MSIPQAAPWTTMMLAVTMSVTVAGCGGDRATETDAEAELERLRALGYVGFTESQVQPGETTVPILDEERSAAGYNLISNRDLTSAQLFDARGRIVRSWEDPGANHWSNAELLQHGDLLVTGSEQKDATGSNFLLRMSWDGNVLWRKQINAHHDAELTPSGTIATLTFHFRKIPSVSAEHEVKDHSLTLLTPDGEVLEEHSFYEMLCAGSDAFTCNDVAPKTQEDTTFIDLLHPNSIEFMRHPQLAERHPLYAAGNVLVSFRHQDTVAIFNWETRRLLWSWGRGEISAQHDATVLDNGNILLFDNGVDRSWSRIIELDPIDKRIVWEYKAEDPASFFSLRKGSNQRLANGNTLIANSDNGEAFEVTREGEIVWRFLNPNADERGRRATIVRIHRYAPEFIEGLIDRPGAGS